MVHDTYPTLKPRLVFYPLKPRLVEHTHALFFWDVSIRNSLRSNGIVIIILIPERSLHFRTQWYTAVPLYPEIQHYFSNIDNI